MASGVVNTQKITKLKIIIADANLVASFLEIAPEAIGRCLVRDINLSVSASITMLNAFAAPAAKVPPIKEAIVGINGGHPPAAKKRAGTVVIINSSTTRSFISSIYARIGLDY